MDNVKNFAKATVAQGYDDSATSIDIDVADSVRIPADAPFNLVWWNASDYPDPADDPQKEIVRCTARDGETLTITRGQETTGAADHNEANKTYKVAQCFTKEMIRQMVGDVFSSGTAILVDTTSETIELRQSATKGISVVSGSTTIEDTTSVDIGDPVGNNNSSFMSVSDQNQRVSFIGMDIATDRTESATVAVGTLVAKLAIRDGSGTIIGYLPLYGSIT